MNRKISFFAITFCFSIISASFLTQMVFAEEEWNEYRIIGNFYLPNGELDFQSQDIPYLIDNGEIKKVRIVDSGTKLIFKINTYGDGILELKIPRNVIDITVGSIDDQFRVLHDGVEKKFSEKNPTQNDLVCSSHLVIPFSDETSNIEIVSSFLQEEPFRRALGSLYSIDCLVDPSPKLQIKSGVQPEKVKCNEDLVLILKATDNSPVCVKSTTAQKLLERGWTILGNP